MKWLLEGYNDAGGNGNLGDRLCCLEFKREFYETFCRRAIREGNASPEMLGFMNWVVALFGDGIV